MPTFSELIGKVILIVIVVFGLFAIIYDVQTNNNAPQPLSDNPVFNETLTELEQNINSGSEDINTQYESFITENPVANVISIVLKSIVSFGKTGALYLNILFSLIIKLPILILGIPPTIVNIVSSWILIVAVVVLWVLYKLGG